jgi:putative ABC transport system ATP-binding protein
MIYVQNLSKSFRDGDQTHPVLRDLSMKVEEGEFVALLGRSGSGKSTLLNCLAGIETVDSGSIAIDGTDLARLDDDARTALRRETIGIVFQFFNLLPVIPVLDNVLLPAELAGRADQSTRERAHQLLRSLGLAGREGELPDHLSGGEQQRVAIARSLINQPRLLLADEPTGNLDSKTSYEVMELFIQLHESGQTVILVTHEPDIAEYSHRVITILDGKVVKDIRQTPKQHVSPPDESVAAQ